MRQSLDVFSRALEGKQLLNRSIMRDVLESEGIDTSKQRLYRLSDMTIQKKREITSISDFSLCFKLVCVVLLNDLRIARPVV